MWALLIHFLWAGLGQTQPWSCTCGHKWSGLLCPNLVNTSSSTSPSPLPCMKVFQKKQASQMPSPHWGCWTWGSSIHNPWVWSNILCGEHKGAGLPGHSHCSHIHSFTWGNSSWKDFLHLSQFSWLEQAQRVSTAINWYVLDMARQLCFWPVVCRAGICHLSASKEKEPTYSN